MMTGFENMILSEKILEALSRESSALNPGSGPSMKDSMINNPVPGKRYKPLIGPACLMCCSSDAIENTTNQRVKK